MQITGAETIQLRIPFSDPGKGEGLFPGTWDALDFVLLRVETDTGLVGWGEAFSYFCADAVAALTRQSVAPLLIGKDPREIDPILAELRQKLHIIGRYGITMFGISAADIALWDLAAKAEGVSLAERLGGHRRADVPAYASLIRYADSDLVREIAGRAVAEGYRTVKLHEIAPEHIRAGHEAVGPGIALTNDVNCNWTLEQTLACAPELRELDDVAGGADLSARGFRHPGPAAPRHRSGHRHWRERLHRVPVRGDDRRWRRRLRPAQRDQDRRDF